MNKHNINIMLHLMTSTTTLKLLLTITIKTAKLIKFHKCIIHPITHSQMYRQSYTCTVMHALIPDKSTFALT